MKNFQKRSSEDNINYIKDFNHTLRNRLIAITGYCELMLDEGFAKTLQDDFQDIRNIVKQTTQISDEISKKVNDAIQETDKNYQDKLLEVINQDFNRVSASIQILRPKTELLISKAQPCTDKATEYKQKVIHVLDKLDEYIK